MSVCKMRNIEGIVYKFGSAKYEYGRSKYWKKFKPERETLDLIVMDCYKGANKFADEFVVFKLGYVDDQDNDNIVKICSVFIGALDIANKVSNMFMMT